MGKAVLFVLILYGLDSAFGATHTLRNVYSGTTGIPDIPEFVAVGLVDEEPFVYYDSKIRRETPRVQWMEKSEGPDYWEHQTQILIGWEQVFKNNIEVVKSRFNQTGGIHTYQLMYGCEWDDDTGTTGAHEQHGYDGEDFLALDVKSMSWVAPVPQAVPTKDKFNNDGALIENYRNYFNQICIEWLKKYLDYGKETLQRKAHPEVSLLQKDSSSPVSCHATGFFPKGIMVTWKKNGQDVHEDVETSETLPNGDGSFQTSARLTVKPEDMKTNTYTCVVQHKSSTKDIVIELKDENVKRNRDPDGSLGVIVGCVVAAVLAIALIAAVAFVMWKKNKGYDKANSEDTNSDKSDPVAQKA